MWVPSYVMPVSSLEHVGCVVQSDGVTLDRVNAYLQKNKPGPFTIVTVGPKELRIP